MATYENEALCERIARLERRVWLLGTALAVLLVGGSWSLTWPTMAAQAQPQAIRARSITIVDDQGRDRIVIGSPVPNPREGVRSSASTGFVINDPAGYERFGLGLFEDGRVVMGFDAPPGTGDSRNRERINLVADTSGGSYIRFVNRKTGVPGRLILDDTDQFYLEFLDFPDGKVVSRRIGFKGEQVVELPR